jgi:hypothetical protein
MMTNKLEMPLEQFAEAVAKENERLISGPGGIMEMKQTIADKERRIEKLESQFKLYFHAFNKAAARIEKLEAALRSIAANACCDSCREAALVARKALEGEVPLEWTENYGQGSEPWLKDVKE